MASTYSNLKIQLMATGENSTTWGNVTNINLGTALEEAIVGSVDVAFSSADVTLTLTDTNATQSARNMRLNLTGTATSGYNLIVPAIEKPYIINNATDGTITVKNTTGTGIAVPTGKTIWVYNNGTNVVAVTTHLTSLTLGTALPVASGGTGQTTYTDGQLLIGNSTGNTLTKATLTAGSGIAITNGAGSISIASTGGGGSVTSVSVVSANGFAGTVATATSTPAITLTTSITGVLKGNGTAISAATAGTDYVIPSGLVATATTANALNTANHYQVHCLGVGTAASTVLGEIRAVGNITAYYSSDARLKENVHPIQNALGIVSAVGGKTFDWTDAYVAEHGGEDGYFVRKSDFGVIAQDVQAVFPLAVHERGDGTLAVDYEKLVAVAFAAIAELRAEVEALKNDA
jgi:hypothetical protein